MVEGGSIRGSGLIRSLALVVALAAFAVGLPAASAAAAEAGPRVLVLTPPYGPTGGGAQVLIHGVNLSGASAVDFGSTPASAFTVEAENLIRATAPAGTGTVYVTVTIPEGTSAAPTELSRYVYAQPPEFGTCKKPPFVGGYFSASGCVTARDTEKESGFAWYPAFGGPNALVAGQGDFTFTSSKQIKLETIGKHAVTCTGASGGGEIAGLGTVSLGSLVLSGCQAGSLGACQSIEAAAGEVRTDDLEGELGDTSVDGANPAKDQVGLQLHGGGGEAIAGFWCGVAPVSVRGSVILSLSAPNRMRSKFVLGGVEKHGVQKIVQFAGGPEAALEMAFGDEAPFEGAGLKIKATLEVSGIVEVDTVA